jgi:hypothetical protein
LISSLVQEGYYLGNELSVKSKRFLVGYTDPGTVAAMEVLYRQTDAGDSVTPPR